MTHPAHLIEMARSACRPIYMPSGVAVPLDIRQPLRELFGEYRLLYDAGFGYVLQVGHAQLLIGGRWGDWGHVKAWLKDNQPSKAVVVAGFWQTSTGKVEQLPLFEAA